MKNFNWVRLGWGVHFCGGCVADTLTVGTSNQQCKKCEKKSQKMQEKSQKNAENFSDRLYISEMIQAPIVGNMRQNEF